MPSPLAREPAQAQLTPLCATSAVWRLEWRSRSVAQLLSAPLLRDAYLSKPLPPLKHSVIFNLFECVPIHIHLISQTPPSTGENEIVHGAETTGTFLLPPVAPSLQPRSLLPLSHHSFLSGAHVPSLLRLCLTSNTASPACERDRATRPVLGPKTLLVHGPYGCGKTSAIAHAAHLSSANFIHLNASFVNTHALSPAALRQTLLHFVASAKAAAPVLILLDDVQFTFPPDDTPAAAALLQAIDAVHDSNHAVTLVLAASPSADAVHPFVRAAVHAQSPLALSVAPPFGPLLAKRHASDVDQAVINEKLGLARVHTPAAVVDWARSLQFVCSEPRKAIGLPVATNGIKGKSSTNMDTDKLPSTALPIDPKYYRAPEWAALSASVGGLRGPQRLLQRALLWPVTRANTLSRLSLPNMGATLLYGPPGTGKTALLRATAKATSRTLHPVDAAALARGQIGASERLLIEAFQAARAVAPAILFFDEVDALLVASSAPHHKRLNSVMAQLLDDASDGVGVVAATNRPWAVAPELLRSGRFDTKIHVPLPTREERADIARVLGNPTWKASVREYLIQTAASHVVDGFSGADLAGVTRRAGLSASARKADVAEEDITHAFKVTTPSVDPEQAKRIAAWR